MQRSKIGLWVSLSDIRQNGRRFCDGAPIGDQCRNPALWIDCQIVLRTLLFGAEVQASRRIVRVDCFQGDVGRDGAGLWCVVEG